MANGSADGLDAYAGQQLILFNGGDSTPGGSLAQTFTTTVGQYYTVSFAEGEEIGPAGSPDMSITATAISSNNALLASNYCVPANLVWTLFQLNFTATTTNTTLVFKDTSTATVNVDIHAGRRGGDAKSANHPSFHRYITAEPVGGGWSYSDVHRISQRQCVHHPVVFHQLCGNQRDLWRDQHHTRM